MNHPQFAGAVERYCREMATPDAQAWPTTKLFHQLGRYMVSFLLIHHYQDWHDHGGPPATLGRLQASCPLSPRQTAAIVAGLRAGKLLAAAPIKSAPTNTASTNAAPINTAPIATAAQENSPKGEPTTRAKTLIPAPPVTQAIARSMLAVLATADQLDQRERADRFAADIALQNEMVYRSAQFVERHGTLLEAFPRVHHFTEKDCGYLILCAVIASALGASERQEPLSCRHLARHFRISRSHASNLLGHAAAHQWFATDGRGRLAQIAPDLIDEFKQWIAAEMAHYAGIADEILAN